MQQKLKYDQIKHVKTDTGNRVILTKKIYCQDTGVVKSEIESLFDPLIISDRIAVLELEIARLKELGSKIETESFDIIDDKRSDEFKAEIKKKKDKR